MKFSKLLVLSAMWLVGVSANAEVPDGVWTMPEPTGLEFTTFTADGTQYYLYNPGAKMFFASGNSWNTQASVRTFGYPFWLEPTAEEDAPEGSYELWDDFYNPDRSDVVGYHNCFTDDGGSTWVDHGTQGNYSWAYEIVNGCVRFQNVALIADKPEYAGTYIGWTGDYAGEKNSSVLKMILPDTPGTCIDWKAVTVDSYQAFAENEAAYKAYTDGVDCFFRANELRALMIEAEANYINIAAALAVYNNTSSTAEQLANAATPLKELIPLKKKLKTAIEDAKKAGFTETAPYEEVLTNLDATKAEVEKAIDDLGKALVEWGKTHASVENPADMTAKIVNPNFDNASSSGWSGSSPNMVGSGSHGPANVAETWNNTFNMYQDIKELPAGVYALGAKTSWRGSWNDMVNHVGPAAKLYVVVDEKESSVPFNYIWGCYNTQAMGGETYFGTGAGENSEQHEDAEGNMVTYYSPNDPSAFRLYEEAGFYDTKVMFGVTDGNIRIGVKNPEKLGDADNWSCYDTFTLTYYGSGADAAELYLNETVKNFSSFVPEEGAIFTQAYLDAYDALCKNVPTVNSFEEATAFLASIEQAYNDLLKNIDLWKKYDKLVTDAYTMYTVDDKYSWLISTGVLADYYEMDDNGQDGPGYETIIGEHSLTNAELEAEIAFVQGLIDAILEEYKNQVQPGDDVTHLLANPDFEYGLSGGKAEGWTVDVTNNSANGNITPGPLGSDLDQLMMDAIGKTNHCFEAWHVWGFDVWQEVKNAPVGVYEIQVQGYVRCEASGYTRGDLEGLPTVPIYLYLNNARTNFPDVFSEIVPNQDNLPTIESWSWETVNGYNSPNSMGGASICFAWDMYKKSAYGLVAKPGDSMRIGVKGEMNDNWWCIWDNFHLVYQGFKPEVVEPALDEALKTLDLSQYMGKSVYAKAEELNKRAQEAKAAGDGREMFEVLNDVYDLSEEITASVALFKKLWDAAETTLGEAIDASPAASDVRNQAAALQGRILGGIENHEYDDADVEGLLNEIDEMITKLGIPAGGENATDANPADFTNTIKNPTYDENVNGWSGTAAAWGADMANAEIFNANFDYYQELKGLYAGTYQLSVQGFYRAGSATIDYSTWVENPELNNNSFLYASVINGTDTVTYSKALIRLAAEASSEAEVGEPSDGYVWAKERTSADAYDGMVVCNSMTTGGYEFENGKYANNVVTFKVTDGAKVRLGLKKNVNIDQNWTLWDNWKLTYFGKSSDKTVDGDPSGIENLSDQPMVNVEYFTLDGRKASMLQKGIMIQKMTLGNGAVIVRKVRK